MVTFHSRVEILLYSFPSVHMSVTLTLPPGFRDGLEWTFFLLILCKILPRAHSFLVTLPVLGRAILRPPKPAMKKQDTLIGAYFHFLFCWIDLSCIWLQGPKGKIWIKFVFFWPIYSSTLFVCPALFYLKDRGCYKGDT